MEQQEMINEVYIWVLSGVLGLLLTVLVIVGRMVAINISKKFDDLLKSIKQLSDLTIQQTEQIRTLFMNREETNKRLNDHASRIRKLEFGQIANRRHGNTKNRD